MARMGFDSPSFANDGKDYDATHFGGYDTRIDPNDTYLDGDGHTQTKGGAVGTGASDAVGRYRSLGEAAAGRQAYQVNFGLANGDRQQGLQARETQKDALQLQRGAALGQAPSRAEIEGGQVGDQSLAATLGASAGGRGMGALAAQMQAQRGQGGMQLGAQTQAMGARSGEMGQAIGAYGAGATGIRKGDYTTMGLDQSQADAQAQSEMAQRQLNDTSQMQFEQRGFDVNNADLQRGLRQKQIYASGYARQLDQERQNTERHFKMYGAISSAVGGGAGSMASMGSSGPKKQGGGDMDPYSAAVSASDERTKSGAVPLYHDETYSSDPRMTPALEPNMSHMGRIAAHRARAEEASARHDEAVQRRRLHRAMEQEVDFSRNVMGENPYPVAELAPPRAYEAGPQAAPKGYAASRAGQAGAMFGDGGGAEPMHAGVAPGTSDFSRSGEEVDLKMMRSDERTKQNARTMLSVARGTESGRALHDAGAGLSAAYDFGHDKVGPAVVAAARKSADAVRAAVSSSSSDERTKQDAHAEHDMGRALEEGFRPYEYEYKPEFAGAERQSTGEKNVGPMAQDMARNPITGNAVKEGDDGLLRVDLPKLTKTNSAGIGYLAAKMREQQDEISRLKKGGR